MEKYVVVRQANEHCSCSSCFAQNYDSLHPIGERVDEIYEIKIGIVVNRVCKACLQELRNQIDQILL